MANIQIDNEEYEKSLCEKCLNNLDKVKCPCCGEEIKTVENVQNKSFDLDRFNELAGEK